MAKLTMTVSFNGLRKNMLHDLIEVMNSIEPLVQSYKNSDYEPSMSKWEAEKLFNNINILRGEVGALMCCYDESLGASDLSQLAEGLPWIEFEEDEEG